MNHALDETRNERVQWDIRDLVSSQSMTEQGRVHPKTKHVWGGGAGGGRGYVRVQTASSDECPREERGAGRGGPASRQPPYLQNSRGDTTWAVLAPHRSEKACAHHHNTTAYDIFGKRVGLGDCAFNLPWFLFCFREKWIYDEYSAFTPLDIPRSEGWWWLTLLSTYYVSYPRTIYLLERRYYFEHART